jgi:WD40 repeat protein
MIVALSVAIVTGLVGILWALSAMRKIAYASDLKLAQHALEQNNLGRALALLNGQRPKPWAPDLRNWEWRYLWQQCQSDELPSTLPEMKGEMQCLAFSPDGKYLAVATAHNELLLWDLLTTQKIAQARTDYQPTRLRFSPDSRILAVGLFQHGFDLWDWQPPKLTHRDVPLPRAGTSSDMHFDAQSILAVDQEAQRLCRWDLATGKCTPLFPVVYTQVLGLGPWYAFSRDGELLATCSNSVAIIWETRSGAKLATVDGHGDGTEPLAFSPDGRWLALGTANGWLTICEARSGREVTNFPLAHASDLERGEFTPDGKLLVTADYDQTLKLWRTSDWSLAGTLRGHRGEVYDVAVSPDGKVIASASSDGTVRFWSTKPPEHPRISRKLPQDALSWSLSPDGQWLFFLFPNGFFRLWNLDTWGESPVQSLGATNITVASLLNGGRAVVVGDSAGSVRLLDLSTKQTIRHYSGFDQVPVAELNCSADGGTIVAQSTAHLIKAWDTKTAKKIDEFTSTNHVMWDRLPVSPDGRYVASATIRGDIDFRGLRNQEKYSLPPNEKQVVTSVAFYRDGHHVVTASLDKSARVWDLRKPQAARLIMQSDLTGLRSVALSPDERRIAVGDDLGRPRKVKLFDSDSGQEVAALDGPMSSIVYLAFRPDGSTIVAVSADAVFVWRAPSWAEIEAKEKRAASPSKL